MSARIPALACVSLFWCSLFLFLSSPTSSINMAFISETAVTNHPLGWLDQGPRKALSTIAPDTATFYHLILPHSILYQSHHQKHIKGIPVLIDVHCVLSLSQGCRSFLYHVSFFSLDLMHMLTLAPSTCCLHRKDFSLLQPERLLFSYETKGTFLNLSGDG